MKDHHHAILDVEDLPYKLLTLRNGLAATDQLVNELIKAAFERDAQLSELRRRIDRLEQNKCC